MFGTSVPVPRQEDHGVDLYCTPFSERQGQRVWPVAYYSVQVKSEVEPWEFTNPESVRWLVEYPAPLLLCFIQKKKGLVRVYQTMAARQPGPGPRGARAGSSREAWGASALPHARL